MLRLLRQISWKTSVIDSRHFQVMLRHGGMIEKETAFLLIFYVFELIFLFNFSDFLFLSQSASRFCHVLRMEVPRVK